MYNNYVGINILNTGTNTYANILNTLLFSNDGDGIDIQGAYNNVFNNTQIYNNGGDGIFGQDAEATTINNTQVYNNG